MVLIRVVPVLAVVLLMAAPAEAQPLADVARKEQARREAVPTPGKAYTNGDLTPDRTGAPTSEAPAAATGASPVQEADGDTAATAGGAVSREPAAGDAAAGQAEPRLDEAYWRRQARVLRGRVEKAREALAVVSGPSEGNERQQARVAELRAAAEGVLTRAEATLAAFEREARTLNVPAEWIR